MDFESGIELLKLCKKEQKKISRIMLEREVAEGKLTEKEVLERLKVSWDIMKKSSVISIKEPQKSMGGLIGGEAKKLMEATKEDKRLCGDTLTKAIAYGLSVLEVNSSMGLIVAAPTAGSCGVIPGILLAMQETYEFTDAQILEGLLNASAVGYLFMRNASVSGAQAGCQAEVGAASAMGAAAITELLGGTPEQSLQAASIAISNLLGLVCDPIGGLVESPCQSRNAVGISNAFACAQMALADITHVVPFDEMLQVMFKVGCRMPVELRETALGGNAASPTGCRFNCSH